MNKWDNSLKNNVFGPGTNTTCIFVKKNAFKVIDNIRVSQAFLIISKTVPRPSFNNVKRRLRPPHTINDRAWITTEAVYRVSRLGWSRLRYTPVKFYVTILNVLYISADTADRYGTKQLTYRDRTTVAESDPLRLSLYPESGFHRVRTRERITGIVIITIRIKPDWYPERNKRKQKVLQSYKCWNMPGHSGWSVFICYIFSLRILHRYLRHTPHGVKRLFSSLCSLLEGCINNINISDAINAHIKYIIMKCKLSCYVKPCTSTTMGKARGNACQFWWRYQVLAVYLVQWTMDTGGKEYPPDCPGQYQSIRPAEALRVAFTATHNIWSGWDFLHPCIHPHLGDRSGSEIQANLLY